MERVEASAVIERAVELCARDRAFFEAAVRALMCTVELEDRLARRRRVLGSAPLRSVLSGPWDRDPSELEEPRAVEPGAYLSYLRRAPPLVIAFETVAGGVLYAVDRGCARVAVARERGLGRIPVEVYAPPYRLPTRLSVSARLQEPGWILLVGGNPPEVAVPAGEEGVEALLQLLKLRGVRSSP